MSSQQIQMYLWVSQPVLDSAVAAIMLRRKLHKEFPAFFIYNVAQVLMFAVAFPAFWWDRSGKIYYAVFWVTEALNVTLAFKIIHEVFLDVFRPYPALKDLGTALFKWAAVIMVLVSVVLISLAPAWDDPLNKTIMVVHRCVNVVQCGLVVFLLAFCKNLGVTWRRPCFGIALGFGILSGEELLISALYSGRYLHGHDLNMIHLGAECFGILVWLLYSLLRQRQPLVAPVLVPQRWDEALMEIQPQEQSESLIPMFETMVDRALSRAQGSRVH